jgi:hypothetical protein
MVCLERDILHQQKKGVTFPEEPPSEAEISKVSEEIELTFRILSAFDKKIT